MKNLTNSMSKEFNQAYEETVKVLSNPLLRGEIEVAEGLVLVKE